MSFSLLLPPHSLHTRSEILFSFFECEPRNCWSPNDRFSDSSAAWSQRRIRYTKTHIMTCWSRIIFAKFWLWRGHIVHLHTQPEAPAEIYIESADMEGVQEAVRRVLGIVRTNPVVVPIEVFEPMNAQWQQLQKFVQLPRRLNLPVKLRCGDWFTYLNIFILSFTWRAFVMYVHVCAYMYKCVYRHTWDLTSEKCMLYRHL